ncbi:MAG TPA: hypothetical protein VGR28_08665 [Candidatus Thermoplasmatota archaeon]|jgi:hypothetical protein|nr:hypothetical protein [Candidatus Thermoplasmatota archaeon]
MVDADTAVNVVTAVGVLGGLAIVGLQLRQTERRDRAALIEAIHSFRSQEYGAAYRLLASLPDGLSGEELRGRGPEIERAAYAFAGTCGPLGLLVHRRVLPLDDVADLLGGQVRLGWRKMRGLAELRRSEVGSGKPFEWTQWLAERLEEHARPEADAGAYVVHKAWQPQARR